MSGRMQRSGADLGERRFLTGPPVARASATAYRSEPTDGLNPTAPRPPPPDLLSCRE